MYYLKENFLFPFLLVLALISFWGAVVYRLYSLNNPGIIISLILVIISFFIIHRIRKTDNSHHIKAEKKLSRKKNIYKYVFFSLYLLIIIACFLILLNNSAANTIVSPWQAIPGYFFLIYALATSLIIINIFFLRRNMPLALISIHYFLSFSIAVLLYKLGYGFDPFVHEATMSLIEKTGAVTPKPFYYLGQYSLIVIINKLTTLSIVWLDRLLVPLLAALTLPFALYKALDKLFEDTKFIKLTILFLLITPYSFFIVTTPQNLAYFFLILIIILGLACKNYYELIIIYALALATLMTQPIAGVPAILFALMLTVYHLDNAGIKRRLYFLIFLMAILVLPLAFYVLQNGSLAESIGPAASDSAPGISTGAGAMQNLNLFELLRFENPNQENFILNFIYLYAFNLKYIYILLVLAGIGIAYKFREYTRITRLYLLISVGFFISFFISRQLSFAFLIDYERTDFSSRILIVAVLFLLPFILFTIYGLIKKLAKKNLIIISAFTIFFVSLATASHYLSYPRFDNYFNSHFYSVGQGDIDAVRWINDSAENGFIVLANQQVSAAALREFGFKKYFSVQAGSPDPRDCRNDDPESCKAAGEAPAPTEIFYYPIPTGGPLYQYYLDMVYNKPSRETMEKAMHLVDVNEAYFVLNKYWWAFPKILEEAKLEADSYQEFDNGAVYVFKY